MTEAKGAVLARAKAVPLVTLVAVVGALVALRANERRRETLAGTPALESGAASLASASAARVPSLARSAKHANGDAETPHAPRMLHGDARHTNRALGVRGPARESVAWTASVGGAVEAQVVASPDEATLYVATLAGDLVALDARSGAKRWTVTLGARAYATPCVGDDGTVYAGSDAQRFVAVTPGGQVAWRLELDGEADTACTFARDGTLVLAAGAHVYGVRPHGDLAWRFDARKKVFTAPAIEDDGSIAFGSQDHHAYMLTPSGALAWTVDLGADVDGAAALEDDGDVIVGTDAGDVVRLRAKTGEIAWRAPVGGYVRGALSITRDGSVLAGVYGPTPRMVRVSTNGVIVASLAIRGTGARELGVHGGGLEDANGAVYFGAQDDEVRGVGPDGAWLWSHPMGDDVDAPLTLLSNGALVAASDAGHVTLFGP